MALQIIVLLTCDRPEGRSRILLLEPGSSQRHTLGPGEVHVYPLHLEAGEQLHIEIVELEGDLLLELSGPSAVAYPTIDSSQDLTRIEPVFLSVTIGGEHRLALHADEPSAYEIRRDLKRTHRPDDILRGEAYRAFFEARQQRKESAERAIELYRDAIRGWRDREDRSQQAAGHYDLARFLERHGHAGEAVEAYTRSAELYRELEDLPGEALVLHRWGRSKWDRGDFEGARDLYAQALERWRRTEVYSKIAGTAFDLADVEYQLGRPETARELLQQAIPIAQKARKPLIEVQCRTLLASVYHYRGETSRAIRELRAALRLLEPIPATDPWRDFARQKAITLTQLATTLPFERGATATTREEAILLLDKATALRHELRDRRGLAVTLNGRGLVYEQQQRPREAFLAYQTALSLLSTSRGKGDLAVVQGNRCRALEQRGELHEARRYIYGGLEVVERMRADIARNELRATFTARTFDFYQLAIDVELELHTREPLAGHADAAFALLERVRARSFLEALPRTRRDTPPSPEREAAHARLNQLAVEGLIGDLGSDDRTAIERTIDDLLEQIQTSEAASQQSAPAVLSPGEVQSCLGPDTLLLSYHLGEHRSAVWAITDQGVACHLLPARTEIETAARRLHEALRGGPHKIRAWKVDRLAEKLSRLILVPVAAALDRRDLVVLSDGALAYVPFALLPRPALGAEPETAMPLLVEQRVTTAPSASALIALNQRRAARNAPDKLLALVAAPLLRRSDGSPPAGGSFPEELTAPLPFAREAAAAIQRLLDPREVSVALGPAATRSFVLDPSFGRHQILHFATHGHLDDRRGELSALVLAQSDRATDPGDGFLFAYEVARLELPAQLVVVSACETALGEEIRGEGIVGLSRGFLAAGARQVLVSLWRVDDEATAALMAGFYRRYLAGRTSAAEALRQAQLELRAGRWSQPYFWAPFILVGDSLGKNLPPT